MAAITRSQMSRQLLPGINALFGAELKRYKDEHLEIYTQYNSEKAFEEDVKLAMFQPASVKPEAAPVAQDISTEVWSVRYEHETIALSFSITQEAREDNLYGSVIKRNTEALARSLAYTKQTKAAAVLNNGFNAAFPTGDGLPLFAGHITYSGGVNFNTPNGSSTDLNETSLESAINQISTFVDERGMLLAARAKKLVVPSNLQFVAPRLLATELAPFTSDNQINAVKYTGAISEGYTINHYLTDPDAWFLLTDVPGGFKHFVRIPEPGQTVRVQESEDEQTGNMLFKTRERYSFGVSDQLAAWGSPG